MAENRWQAFGHLGAEAADVFTALTSIVSGPMTSVGRRRIELGSPAQLVLGYSNKGRPLVYAAPGAAVDWSSLVAQVEEALSTTPVWVTTALTGRFRSMGALRLERMQVRPVRDLKVAEPISPGLPMLNALLVDVEFDCPAGAFLGAQRTQAILKEAANLLTAAMWPPVWLPVGRQDWAIVWPPTVPVPQNVRAQPGFLFDAEEQASVAGPPTIQGLDKMKLIEHSRFVRGPVDLLSTGAQYAIDTLPRLYERLTTLPSDSRLKANRALAWMADGVRANDASVRIACTVAGVEALLPDVPTKACSECGQPRYSLSKRVKDFMDEFVGPALREEFRDGIYAIRSSLVHGLKHYDVDEMPFSPFAEKHIDELKVTGAANAAVLNWLLAQ